MVNEDVITFFSENCETDGVPNVPDSKWHKLIETYAKDDIRDSLAEYIHRNKIPFPYRDHPEDKFRERFIEFAHRSMSNQWKHFPNVKERYDYKYTYADKPLGVIDKSHTYNVVADYFQQKNRLKCGASGIDSPYDIWIDQEKLRTMNWIFWRFNKDGPYRENFLASFRVGTYTATQFRPSVAKALYEKHNAKNVLDTSCGWGDRLAGFYATASTKLYVGCDPNPEVFETYKIQCVEYEKILGGNPKLIESENYFECIGKKTVKIWNLPSEDVDWDLYVNTFDLYFTSPPYFDTERYAAHTNQQNNQSWSRYSSFNTWKTDFFFKVSEMVWKTIRNDGYMMINIIEPRTSGNKRLNLCDDMVEYFSTFKDSSYIGKIGMRMMARPHAEELQEIFIEPIWVFRKGNTEYQKEPSLFD